MNQEKFGCFIKEIRKKNNLTQKQLADKYNVTYQAVSKWENGKNMPDIALIKRISKDFNVSLEELFDGEYKKEKKNYKKIVVILFLIVTFLLVLFWILKQQAGDFQFKTLSSNCENFNISGNIAYNESKSAIYITNIKYCGGNDTKKYNIIECALYEVNGNMEKKVSSYQYNDKNKAIKLEDFLQDLTFSVADYDKTCKEYSENSLYLSIVATNDSHNMTIYKIPLSLNSCSN